MISIGKNIRLIREMGGLTRLEFAKILDVKTKKGNFSEDRIYTYEETNTEAPSFLLQKIAHLVGLSEHDLKTIQLTHVDINQNLLKENIHKYEGSRTNQVHLDIYKPTPIAKNIELVREELKLSQLQFAEVFEIEEKGLPAVHLIQAYEEGRLRPPTFLIKSIAILLNRSIEDIENSRIGSIYVYQTIREKIEKNLLGDTLSKRLNAVKPLSEYILDYKKQQEKIAEELSNNSQLHIKTLQQENHLLRLENLEFTEENRRLKEEKEILLKEILIRKSIKENNYEQQTAIPFVGVSNHAEYIQNHRDPHYLMSLPSFPLSPGLDPRGTEWRYFEFSPNTEEKLISGLQPGDIVLANIVPVIDWINLVNAKSYIIVTDEQIFFSWVKIEDYKYIRFRKFFELNELPNTLTTSLFINKKIPLSSVREIWRVRKVIKDESSLEINSDIAEPHQ